MHRSTLATCLSVCSLTAFAFDPCRSGWHGSSEIGPTITFANYLGTGRTGPYIYTANSTRVGVNSAEGEFSLAGFEAKQSVGWREWFTLNLFGSYAQSSVAASDWNAFFQRNSAAPSSLLLWDIAAEAFTSLALDSHKAVWLEPAIGYSFVGANMKNAPLDNPKARWEELKFRGPTLGLYLRLLLSSKVSLKMGGGYMASQLNIKKYSKGVATTLYPYTAGRLMGSYHFHNRRHGLFGLARLDYLWKSWVRFYSAVDFRSYSSGGTAEQYGTDPNSPSTAVPTLSRLRFSWGFNFAY